MILKVGLNTIKSVGLNAAVVLSYLKKCGVNIKTDQFFDVKLKTMERELGIKRVNLKAAINQLETDKYR